MMVIRGETKPDAHAAAVRSDVTRHGRLAVFQFDSFSGKAFEAMLLAFGEKSGSALSLSDFGGPLRSISRVITSQRIYGQVEEAFEYQLLGSSHSQPLVRVERKLRYRLGRVFKLLWRSPKRRKSGSARSY